MKSICPSCGIEGHIHITAKRETVPYGLSGDTVSVIVPVHTCDSCGFSYTDESASVIRDFAVAEKLKQL